MKSLAKRRKWMDIPPKAAAKIALNMELGCKLSQYAIVDRNDYLLGNQK